MANTEKTRVENFIRKQKEIDLDNIREVADHYRILDEISKLVKKQMDSLKKTLIENEVEEFFPEEEMKVVYSEGNKKTFLSTVTLYNKLRLEDFIRAATVTEKAIRDLPEASDSYKESVIAEAKMTLDEKTAPSIKVAKMTKKELQEMA